MRRRSRRRRRLCACGRRQRGAAGARRLIAGAAVQSLELTAGASALGRLWRCLAGAGFRLGAVGALACLVPRASCLAPRGSVACASPARGVTARTDSGLRTTPRSKNEGASPWAAVGVVACRALGPGRCYGALALTTDRPARPKFPERAPLVMDSAPWRPATRPCDRPWRPLRARRERSEPGGERRQGPWPIRHALSAKHDLQGA